MIYKEIEDDNYSVFYMESDLKNGQQLRTGNIHKLIISIEDDYTKEIIFNTEQYWIKDNEKGILLNNKGDRMLFDSYDDSLIYISKNKYSLYDMALNNMKKNGFNSLTDKEKEIIKNHNKK